MSMSETNSFLCRCGGHVYILSFHKAGGNISYKASCQKACGVPDSKSFKFIDEAVKDFMAAIGEES